jgi:hypothetical protein
MKRRKASAITIEGNVAFVELTQGLFATIDASDVDKVRDFVWCAAKSGRNIYAQSSFKKNGKTKTVQMHRLLIECLSGFHVDHIDRNGINNKKDNLRLVSVAKNIRNSRTNLNNSSGIKGVSWHKPLSKWRAQIRENGKKKHLGYYDCKHAAAVAYARAATQQEFV